MKANIQKRLRNAKRRIERRLDGAREDRGKPIGAGSELACFSFHPAKHITTGEGGAAPCGCCSSTRTARAGFAPARGSRTQGLAAEKARREMYRPA